MRTKTLKMSKLIYICFENVAYPLLIIYAYRNQNIIWLIQLIYDQIKSVIYEKCRLIDHF